MNLVSLLILSVVITTEGHTGVRVVVVASAVAVVAVAVTWSRRRRLEPRAVRPGDQADQPGDQVE